jgi:hypothetical protein
MAAAPRSKAERQRRGGTCLAEGLVLGVDQVLLRTHTARTSSDAGAMEVAYRSAHCARRAAIVAANPP